MSENIFALIAGITGSGLFMFLILVSIWALLTVFSLIVDWIRGGL